MNAVDYADVTGCRVYKVENHAYQRTAESMLSQPAFAVALGNQRDGKDNHGDDCERPDQFCVKGLFIGIRVL